MDDGHDEVERLCLGPGWGKIKPCTERLKITHNSNCTAHFGSRTRYANINAVSLVAVLLVRILSSRTPSERRNLSSTPVFASVSNRFASAYQQILQSLIFRIRLPIHTNRTTSRESFLPSSGRPTTVVANSSYCAPLASLGLAWHGLVRTSSQNIRKTRRTFTVISSTGPVSSSVNTLAHIPATHTLKFSHNIDLHNVERSCKYTLANLIPQRVGMPRCVICLCPVTVLQVKSCCGGFSSESADDFRSGSFRRAALHNHLNRWGQSLFDSEVHRKDREALRTAQLGRGAHWPAFFGPHSSDQILRTSRAVMK